MSANEIAHEVWSVSGGVCDIIFLADFSHTLLVLNHLHVVFKTLTEWVIILALVSLPVVYPSGASVCAIPTDDAVVTVKVNCYNFMVHFHGLQKQPARGTVA